MMKPPLNWQAAGIGAPASGRLDLAARKLIVWGVGVPPVPFERYMSPIRRRAFFVVSERSKSYIVAATRLLNWNQPPRSDRTPSSALPTAALRLMWRLR